MQRQKCLEKEHDKRGKIKGGKKAKRENAKDKGKRKQTRDKEPHTISKTTDNRQEERNENQLTIDMRYPEQTIRKPETQETVKILDIQY